VLHLRYESFVEKPAKELTRIASFLGEDWSADAIQEAISGVSQGSIGKGKHKADARHQAIVERNVQPLMDELDADPRFSA
ncbi:MAG: hypothetical protein JKX81_14770, partial [Arenicella sp.]|nr:hypothetical protein [Arenicella sp.]